jgi:23S rRNA pseudouridine2605 synthase
VSTSGHNGDSKAHPGIRLQRVLAAAGVGARRVCERLIEEGRVEVNGETISSLPAFVEPRSDRITVDGRPISLERTRPIYLMVNKPERILVTSADEPGFDRPTVTDLVDHPAKRRLFPVGRLDYNTAGLVLLTSDGALANRLTHPRFGVPKTYRALVKGDLNPASLQRLHGALVKDMRRTDKTSARVRPRAAGAGIELRIGGRDQGRTILEIEIREGRTGNLARSLAAAGVHVRKLERTAIGPLRLTGLARGRWRELERDEVHALKSAARGRSLDAPRRPASGGKPISRRKRAAARQRSSEAPR